MMSEIEKNFQLLREIHEELRDMIHLKEDDIPSKSWEEKYDFLERLREHYSEKITSLRWSKLKETLMPIREEERKEKIRIENSGKNTYQHQHLKEQQKKNIVERNKERRESNRRNTKVQKRNVLKEIQEKEEI